MQEAAISSSFSEPRKKYRFFFRVLLLSKASVSHLLFSALWMCFFGIMHEQPSLNPNFFMCTSSGILFCIHARVKIYVYIKNEGSMKDKLQISPRHSRRKEKEFFLHKKRRKKKQNKFCCFLNSIQFFYMRK